MLDVEDATRTVAAPLVEASLETEAKLTEEIAALWEQHKTNEAAVKRTKEETRTLRMDLGQRLSEMKALLAHTGRGGRWAAYLRSAGLPRSNADRYFLGYKASLNPPEMNCPSDAILESSETGIPKSIQRLLATLQRELTSQQAVFDFVCALLATLPAEYGVVTDSAVEFYRPSSEGSPALALEVDDSTLASID